MEQCEQAIRKENNSELGLLIDNTMDAQHIRAYDRRNATHEPLTPMTMAILLELAKVKEFPTDVKVSKNIKNIIWATMITLDGYSPAIKQVDTRNYWDIYTKLGPSDLLEAM